MNSNQILEFLQFVEGHKNQTVGQVLDKVLRKSRLMTGAEAGTIFVVRGGRGRQRWLEPTSVQNDTMKVKRADFIVPIGPGTIAGYVAHTGRTLLIDDVYAIPKRGLWQFDPSFERRNYRTQSMFCFPLRNLQNEVTGVVQLINCRRARKSTPVPFPPDVALLVAPIARVVGHSIERAEMLDQIRAKNKTLSARNSLLAEQRERIASLQEETETAFQVSVTLLAKAAEIHDEKTGNHILRVNEYSYAIAKLLDLPDKWCDELRYSAQLHDVGKMSVDAAVLKKQGPLDSTEREEMNRHTVYGYQILSASSRLSMAAEIALHHHEKWDGTGYPNGLGGEIIPLSARIVQMADIYDALRSERPYKPSFSHEKAVQIITVGDDRIDPRSHFDPRIIDLFADNHLTFERIWSNLKD